MQTINITNLQKELHATINNAIKFDPIRVYTENGNAILMSEEEFKSWQETLYLCRIKGMEQSIIEGLETPIEDCIKEEDFKW